MAPSLVPYLFIEGHSGSNPVISSGLGGHVFIWDPAISRHVKRFESIEEFNRKAKEIIAGEAMWKIFPAIEAREEVPNPGSPVSGGCMDEISKIAMVCHEANRAYCATLGDHSQKPWDEAEQWQRDSAVLGVKFRMDNPHAPASAQHEAWLESKVADGWVFGPVKDAAAKTHPCIVPYDELPVWQRRKDLIFATIVMAMICQDGEHLYGDQEKPEAVFTGDCPELTPVTEPVPAEVGDNPEPATPEPAATEPEPAMPPKGKPGRPKKG